MLGVVEARGEARMGGQGSEGQHSAAGAARPRPTHPCSHPLLQKKGWAYSREQLGALRGFKRRLGGYASCGEMIWDEFLQGPGGLAIQEADSTA